MPGRNRRPARSTSCRLNTARDREPCFRARRTDSASKCSRSRRLFHPLRYQSWDIAMAEQGPVAVEVNTGSAFNLAQLAWDQGILDEDFAGFLRGCGYKLKS